jgi:hypothetical protein
LLGLNPVDAGKCCVDCLENHYFVASMWLLKVES